MKRILIIVILSFIVVHFPVSAQPWSEKMANSIISYHPTRYATSWDYVNGTILNGFIELFKKTGNVTYYNYIKNTIDYVISSNGVISGYKFTDYTLDQVKEGCAVLYLYNQTGESKYKIAVDTLRKQLVSHPRTSDGGFWHKNVYPNQMWQDGLYMGAPFYAEYSKTFNSSNDFDDISNQIFLMEKHARDATTGLIYHGWDENKKQSWANSVTGCSASFWARAMGWYIMSIVDVLDFMPADYSKRDSVMHVLQRMANAVSKVQDPKTGCWYQVLDQGSRIGNYLESSASCMFVYSLLKAVRLGYIDIKYLNVAKKGYQGILDTFIVANSTRYDLIKTCSTAGLGPTRDGSFAYYISTAISTNDGKALGPFILASLEMERLPTSLDKLSQNGDSHFDISPNPVTNKSILTYSLSKSSQVRIAVYSLNASLLKVCKNMQLPSGRYSENLNFSTFQPGEYIIKFQSDNYAESKKIIIVN